MCEKSDMFRYYLYTNDVNPSELMISTNYLLKNKHAGVAFTMVTW